MLRSCDYQVTTSNRAEKALSLLRENRKGYDIIISDVHMPDMDGFKLLEHVGLEMDLPVIMISADDRKSVVMKGLTHGACDYLTKPVRIEALMTIWKHVVLRQMNERKEFEQSGSLGEGERQQNPNEGVGNSSSLKNTRFIWSVETHQPFVAAVDKLGVDRAWPEKILEMMNVPGLTRENVASHLQKYRLSLRRLRELSQYHADLRNFLMGPRDAAFRSMSSINGLDLQAGHLPAQSPTHVQAATVARSLPISMPILDQSNDIFSFENPSKLAFEDSNGNSSNNSFSNSQGNSLHEIPTAMKPKQLANFRGMNMQQNPMGRDSSPLMMQKDNSNNAHLSRMSSPAPIVQNTVFSTDGEFAHNNFVSNVRASGFGHNELISNGNPHTQTSPMVGFSSSQSNMGKGLLQNEGTSKESQGFEPGYAIFNDLGQHKTTNSWDSENIGLSFESTPHANVQGTANNLNVQPSVLVHQGFSSGQDGARNRNGNGIGDLNMGQQFNTFMGENSLTVESELIPEVSSQNPLLSDQFEQEDILSVLLKQHQELQEGTGPVPNEFSFDGFPPFDDLPF